MPHRVAQVRWDTAKGFHVPELLCKECSSLEETLQVRRGRKEALCFWQPQQSRHVQRPIGRTQGATAACALFGPVLILCWCDSSAPPPPHPPTTHTHNLQVLSLAVRHRRVGSHEMNMESSRSHSIFTGGGPGGVAMPDGCPVESSRGRVCATIICWFEGDVWTGFSRSGAARQQQVPEGSGIPPAQAPLCPCCSCCSAH